MSRSSICFVAGHLASYHDGRRLRIQVDRSTVTLSSPNSVPCLESRDLRYDPPPSDQQLYKAQRQPARPTDDPLIRVSIYIMMDRARRRSASQRTRRKGRSSVAKAKLPLAGRHSIAQSPLSSRQPASPRLIMVCHQRPPCPSHLPMAPHALTTSADRGPSARPDAARPLRPGRRRA